ncbi:MAG: lipoprotein insertase outer membrane protein LolB [Gammaproteobacteria bacterium]|nr:lipoprotein insertase outer membrane protein LolB [Gammaproteobacteria bacterium]MBT8105543.1 lipoprotein insertase outer membrane protein LolB [Gammaproteobacteria bacterium]NNK25557.1 outer membrane lipoprotein LolB [Woeseiaceae bacterium]
MALLVLAGCATLPASIQLPAMDTWETRNAVLGALRNWQFRGRIAVKAGDEGFNGRFDWAQQGDAFDASVGGPLGIGTVRIDGEGDTVRLTDKDGTETRLENAETDLYWRYGWTIPVTSLRYWALGIPDPAVSAETEVDEKGRLRRLEQGGWTVTISRYAEGGGRQMPRILTATNPDTRVRMVIDRWSFFEN